MMVPVFSSSVWIVVEFLTVLGSFTGNPITPDDMTFNNEHGFYIFNGGSDYILRPEVLESNFYAWRVSGDPKYIANAESAVQSYLDFLEVPGGDGGVSGILDVNNANVQPADRVDDTESFFFAEVMTYLSVVSASICVSTVLTRGPGT